jgi:uncharacterized NAD-dependent epimerase/dehydratase family protein
MKVIMNTIEKPYLLYLGTSDSDLSIKTCRGIAQWRPEFCIGQYYTGSSDLTVGLKQMYPKEAKENGAKTMIIGLANSGGRISKSWIADIIEAIEAGLDIASGLHEKLSDIEEIQTAALKHKRKLHDIRHHKGHLPVGNGKKRSGKRILTIGTDCAVGKMYTALALEKEMKKRGFDADFVATGQTGILIKGEGISIDAVLADFISGAVELLSPDNKPEHWDIIEGQGSLFNPSFAGVSTGLLHGAQSDYLILCHEANRINIKDLEGFKVPNLKECINTNLSLAKLTNPNVKLLGVSLNCRKLNKVEAYKQIEDIENRLSLPCVDPMLTGVSKIVDSII